MRTTVFVKYLGEWTSKLKTPAGPTGVECTGLTPFSPTTDQSNISNAYTSGLKEDFGLYGNELNYFNVCYYTAYVVFQVPGLLLMSRPKL